MKTLTAFALALTLLVPLAAPAQESGPSTASAPGLRQAAGRGFQAPAAARWTTAGGGFGVLSRSDLAGACTDFAFGCTGGFTAPRRSYDAGKGRNTLASGLTRIEFSHESKVGLGLKLPHLVDRLRTGPGSGGAAGDHLAENDGKR